jgi:bifunctional DNA-binding transcriptional regulator/antitoxin component of YhaV-PrlF toxin-antitoxin module
LRDKIKIASQFVKCQEVEMSATKVGRRGQITLPKKGRKWLDISEGDRIIF